MWQNSNYCGMEAVISEKWSLIEIKSHLPDEQEEKLCFVCLSIGLWIKYRGQGEFDVQSSVESFLNVSEILLSGIPCNFTIFKQNLIFTESQFLNSLNRIWKTLQGKEVSHICKPVKNHKKHQIFLNSWWVCDKVHSC